MTTKNSNQPLDAQQQANNSSTEKKQGLFRPVGASIFFSVLIAFVACIYFFTAPAIKYFLVESAQKATGAETNLEQVNVTWLPFSVEIIGFQQTDPDKPSYNLVSFERTIASVDLLELILGKTVVEELSIEGLTYDEKRISLGQVIGQTENQTASEQENTDQE